MLFDKIKDAHFSARKEKNTELVLQLGRVITRVNEEVKAGTPLTDEIVISAIRADIKQGQAAIVPDQFLIDQYPDGNYPQKFLDFVSDEKRKMEVLEAFLPKQLTEDEILELLKEKGAQKGMNMGQLMGLVLKTHKSQVDGAMVNKVIREHFQ